MLEVARYGLIGVILFTIGACVLAGSQSIAHTEGTKGARIFTLEWAALITACAVWPFTLGVLFVVGAVAGARYFTSWFSLLISVVLLMVMSGCNMPLEAQEGGERIVQIIGKEEFSPPPIYEDWWVELVVCASNPIGVDVMHGITWYTATEIYVENRSPKRREFLGLWFPETDPIYVHGDTSEVKPERIYIISTAKYDRTTVAHEMLHGILDRREDISRNNHRNHQSDEWCECGVISEGTTWAAKCAAEVDSQTRDQ